VINKARQHHPDVEFRVGGIETITATSSFDALFAFEVIEHVLSPFGFLQFTRKLLKPGAILVMSTPNLECGRRVSLGRWSGFQMSFEHLYFFDCRAIKTLGAAAGFSLKAAFTGGGAGLMPSAGAKPLRYGLKLLLEKMGLLKAARKARQAMRPASRQGYSQALDAHNLFVVLEAATVKGTHSQSV
jgi:hypothetical protein